MLRYITLVFVINSLGTQAQLAHGGSPIGWGQPEDERVSIPSFGLDTLNKEAVLAAADTIGAPQGYRFGEQRVFDVDLITQGEWSDLADGGRVCRLTLRSPGAVMMSVQFSAFQPAWGTRMFLYDEARTKFLGAFTMQNARTDGLFATAFLPGDAVTIEFQEPAGAGPSQLHVSHITHAWQSIFPPVSSAGQRDIDPGYQSSPCHTNVVCPIAENWQDQTRSVILFVRPDGGACNGTLMNNTSEDGTPYVLIAHHCYQPNESQWIFYFNYQSPTCVGDTGQTMQTLVGAVHRSGTYQGDFDIMELNEPPPASFGVYYAGWDRSGTPPQSGACISNPMSDVKKIAFYNTPATSTTSEIINTPSWQNYWYSGLSEASGAPVFDQNRRVVGHMVEGEQTCETLTTSTTLAAKFSANWDGPTPGTRMRDWLDPSNTTMVLDGYDPNGLSPEAVRTRLRVMLEGPYLAGIGMMSAALNNNDLVPLTEPYSALGYVHVGGGGGEATIQDVLNVGGANEVVDWVVVELRDKNDPAAVLATRSALLRRNGTIVGADGTSAVTFNLPADLYYLAVRHRNHLGIMTASPLPLSSTADLIDLTNASVSVRGGTDATTSINGVRCLWSGDVNMNGVVKYTGQSNDRDPILTRIGGSMATAQYSGYTPEDVNMDGMVKYTGAGNDRDAILLNLSGAPNDVRIDHLP